MANKFKQNWQRASEGTERFRGRLIWFLGVEVLGSGALSALTACISWNADQLKGWQVGLITFGVFVVGLFLIYYLIHIWYLFRLDTKSTELYKFITLSFKGFVHLNKSGKLLKLQSKQKKNPEKWLYPVIEYIDLNRQGSAHDDNDVYIKFKIDSSLLMQIDDYSIFVKLRLSLKSQEPESGWYEIVPSESIRTLERNSIGNKCGKYNKGYGNFDYSQYIDGNIIHLGLTKEALEKNNALIGLMEKFRNSEKVLAMLKVGIVFSGGEKDNPIVLDGSQWIAPANDYRRG